MTEEKREEEREGEGEDQEQEREGGSAAALRFSGFMVGLWWRLVVLCCPLLVTGPTAALGLASRATW